MPRTLANFLTSFVLLTLSFLLGLGVTAPAHAQGADDVTADLRMAQEAEPLRRVADGFVSRAIAGDGAGLQGLFSVKLVQRTGESKLQQVLHAQILPFFAQGRGTGRSVTVTRTTDPHGAQGFAFYMWLLPAGAGEARPFTLYTVLEQGRPVVANIVPDRLVPGRHL